MIITTDHGPIRELRLNRPPVNALSTELISMLRQSLEQAPCDGARAIVLSGSPGLFTAGLDVPLLITLDRPGVEALWRELYGVMKALATSPIPVVAALTGHAPAGGTVLAIFCDYRIAAVGDYKIGLSEVQVGIPLPPVIFRALLRQVGPRQAERLSTAGLIVTPEEAFSIGLIDEIATASDVVERALAWCRGLLALPSSAMLATRELARADLAALFQGGFEEELHRVLDTWWSDETQNTLRTLVKKIGKTA